MKTLTQPPSGKSAAANDTEQARIDARNANTLTALRAYQHAHGISDSTKDLEGLAKQIGTSQTYLFRYIKDDFRGDLQKFEARIDAFLSGDQVERVSVSTEIINEAFIVSGMKSFLRHVREHGFIGIGHGPAGRGKTYAARLYAAQHCTSTIYLHVSVWSGGRHNLVRNISRAMQITRAPKGLAMDDYLVNRLRGSDRLLVIDNAHRLTESARRWLADFWEETNMAIALIGNPEIEQQWSRNDQHGSRVGLHRDVTLELVRKQACTARATAQHLIRLHLPAALALSEVVSDAAEVLQQFGACRAVVMRANLARRILSGGRVDDPAEAWKLAKTQLIHAA